LLSSKRHFQQDLGNQIILTMKFCCTLMGVAVGLASDEGHEHHHDHQTCACAAREAKLGFEIKCEKQ
jgi:hypothetical protein